MSSVLFTAFLASPKQTLVFLQSLQQAALETELAKARDGFGCLDRASEEDIVTLERELKAMTTSSASSPKNPCLPQL
jgi:hypothetical protein